MRFYYDVRFKTDENFQDFDNMLELFPHETESKQKIVDTITTHVASRIWGWVEADRLPLIRRYEFIVDIFGHKLFERVNFECELSAYDIVMLVLALKSAYRPVTTRELVDGCLPQAAPGRVNTLLRWLDNSPGYIRSTNEKGEMTHHWEKGGCLK